jgi:hypothetical protein
MGVNRETKVEMSVQAYAKARLEENGWSTDRLDFLESFPFTEFDGDVTTKNYMAFGFNFDDQGRPIELGSDLTARIYTLEFFVFGPDELNAKSVANEMKFVLDNEKSVPLLDVGEAAMPVIGKLLVKGSSAQKVLVNDPKPWERHVWLTTVRVEDEYYPGE